MELKLTQIKLKKVTFKVEVLCPVDHEPEDCPLDEIAEEGISGAWAVDTSGWVLEILEGDAAIEECRKHGTDLEFFGYNPPDQEDYDDDK
jgi:hypothetical protein